MNTVGLFFKNILIYRIIMVLKKEDIEQWTNDLNESEKLIENLLQGKQQQINREQTMRLPESVYNKINDDNEYSDIEDVDINELIYSIIEQNDDYEIEDIANELHTMLPDFDENEINEFIEDYFNNIDSDDDYEDQDEDQDEEDDDQDEYDVTENKTMLKLYTLIQNMINSNTDLTYQQMIDMIQSNFPELDKSVIKSRLDLYINRNETSQKTKNVNIIPIFKQIIEQNDDDIEFDDIVTIVSDAFPSISVETIETQLSNFLDTFEEIE
jgi:hypothetical protein